MEWPPCRPPALAFRNNPPGKSEVMATEPKGFRSVSEYLAFWQNFV